MRSRGAFVNWVIVALPLSPRGSDTALPEHPGRAGLDDSDLVSGTSSKKCCIRNVIL